MRIVLGLLAAVAVAVLGFLILYPRSEPASTEPIARTPERIARGEYLVRHVAFCVDCHSERDWTLASGPIRPGDFAAGGAATFFGSTRYAPNLTPHGLGAWTDGEIVRAITAGVDRNGNALSQRMPFDRYAQMPIEDVYAIVAYLRTLPAIRRDAPRSRDPLPQRLAARLRPQPYRPPAPVNPADRVAYGKYLVTVAGCDFCHGAAFDGGFGFTLPTGQKIYSANITPSPEGIGKYERQTFIKVVRSLQKPIAVPPGKPNTIMPWSRYAGLTEADLGAIYDYLRTVPPSSKRIDRRRGAS